MKLPDSVPALRQDQTAQCQTLWRGTGGCWVSKVPTLRKAWCWASRPCGTATGQQDMSSRHLQSQRPGVIFFVTHPLALPPLTTGSCRPPPLYSQPPWEQCLKAPGSARRCFLMVTCASHSQQVSIRVSGTILAKGRRGKLPLSRTSLFLAPLKVCCLSEWLDE